MQVQSREEGVEMTSEAIPFLLDPKKWRLERFEK